MEKIIILNGSYSIPCDELVIAMKCVQQPEVKRKGSMPVWQVKILRIRKAGRRQTEQNLSSTGYEGLYLTRSSLLSWFWHL